jgi:hypothetical protein
MPPDPRITRWSFYRYLLLAIDPDVRGAHARRRL